MRKSTCFSPISIIKSGHSHERIDINAYMMVLYCNIHTHIPTIQMIFSDDDQDLLYVIMQIYITLPPPAVAQQPHSNLRTYNLI